MQLGVAVQANVTRNVLKVYYFRTDFKRHSRKASSTKCLVAKPSPDANHLKPRLY
jgi:hypothetical protein